MFPYKILLVDDEEDILDILAYNLEKEGFTVSRASNGEQGIMMAENISPDLIVLDIMMPQMDGIQACQILRSKPQFKDTQIIFLTARNEEYSEMAGFEAGANDYVIKPVKPRAFVSRIKALLRRAKGGEDMMEMSEELLKVHDLEIVRDGYVVRKEGEEIIFPKKEFELLCLLASKPGKTFQRDEILSAVWGQNVMVVDRTIDVHIRKIREKLGDEYIQTVKGVGYKFATRLNVVEE